MDEKLTPADNMEHGALSEMLRALLDRTGLSARELARRVEPRVSANYISTLARGRDSKGKPVQPNPKYLRAIADAFAYDPLANMIEPGRAEGLYRQFMAAEGYEAGGEPRPQLAVTAPANHAQTTLYEFFLANPDLSDNMDSLALLTEGGPLAEDELESIKIAIHMIAKARRLADQQSG